MTPREDPELLRAEVAQLREQLMTMEAAARSDPSVLSVLRELPAFVVQLGPDLRIRFVNRYPPGVAPEDVLGAHIDEHVDARSREAAHATIARVKETKEPGRFEAVGTGPEGRLAHYEVQAVPTPGDDVWVVAVDVTQIRARALELQESQDKLRVAVRASGIGLWRWEIATDTVEWDRRMYEINGVEDALSFPRYLAELVHPEDRPLLEASGHRVMTSGRFESPLHRIVRPDGEVRWILSTGTVFTDEAGNLVRMVGGNLDVTRDRTLEDQLRQAQKMEAVGNLTAGVAHNFNNMLMGILPALDLLRDVVPGSHQELLVDATAAGERAADMVRQLMTYARRGREIARREEDVRPVVERALGICRRTFDRHIALKMSAAEDLPPVRCDAGALEQVMMNLLLNARDAVLDADTTSPAIAVELARVPRAELAGVAHARLVDHVAIRVGDNGAGVPAELRHRLFEPFFTTKDVDRGTGLGLATSYAIVREHEGWIDVTSSPGAGATFSVYLPVSEAAAEETRLSPGPAPSGPTTRVLVIDDEPLVRRVVVRLCEALGCRATALGSGDAALAHLVDDAAYDLVLLDLSMPGAPGHTFVPAIREACPDARVFFFTGQAVSPSARAQVDGVLPKPVSRQSLQSVVES